MLDIRQLTVRKPLFINKKLYHYRYLSAPEDFKNTFDYPANIALPLVIDTEFRSFALDDFISVKDIRPRLPICSQIKHVHYDDGMIFTHPEFLEFVEETAPDKLKEIRHPIAKHPLIIGDYLEQQGIDVEIIRDDGIYQREERPPIFQIILYAHFLIADLGMICTDHDFLHDIRKKFASKKFEMSRRLVAGGLFDSQKMGWIIRLNGREYQIALKFVDSIATHNTSYKNFCINSGIEVTDKGLMDQWKTRMDEGYFVDPENFDRYALGDLKVYDCLEANSKNMFRVWQDLGIGEYFTPPRLSIGSTVSKMFEARIFKHFNIPPDPSDPKEIFERLTHSASAEFLKTQITNNAFLLSKCDGGRCRSNNPLLTVLEGNLVDIDIGGAYSSAMSGLSYPFGNPVILATPFNRKNNIGVSFKAVYSVLNDEFIDGLWIIRFQAFNLNYQQDLFPSWYDFRRSSKRQENEITGAVDLETGSSKIFTREIINGVLTSDLLDVVNQWSPRQRNDFFNKVEVLSIGFYPKSFEIDTDSLINESIEHRFKSKSKMMDHFEIIPTGNQAWSRVNLGEFFTDIMRAKRSLHPKKSPLNTLFKLLGNTSYGVSISRFFKTSNMIVGNNITAKVRSMMWFTEKALNLTGSITDGQVFDLDRVIYPRSGKYLHTDKLTRLYSYSKKELHDFKIAELKPLTDIAFKDLTPALVDKLALEHVRKVFPHSKLLNDPARFLKPVNGDVGYEDHLGVFKYEMKSFERLAVFHGSSNYTFDPLDPSKTKFRSYEGFRPHQAYTINESDELIEIDDYQNLNPAQCLLNEIRLNPNAVRRLPPFIKTGILKPSQFSAQYMGKWINSGLNVGDDILKVGRPSYFSLSAFTFQSLEQFNGWKTSHERLKRKYGESFELFYSNEDETIDYLRMLTEIDEMIRKGVVNPIRHLDPYSHFSRKRKPDIVLQHEKTREILADTISKIVLIEQDESEDEDEDNEPMILSSDWE